MSDEALQKAVEEAREAHEAAQERLEAVQSRCTELLERDEELELQIRDAHRDGDDLESVEKLRRQRRRCRAERDDLESEVGIVEGVVEEKAQAVRAAERDLAGSRWEAVKDEAETLGSELVEKLEEVAETVEKIEALDSTAHRLRTTFREDRDGRIVTRDDAPPSNVWPRGLLNSKRTLSQIARDCHKIVSRAESA